MAIIEVKNLTKKFGDFTAVSDVSFSVEEGKIVAFLGPNGAGKTTTIKMLTTLLEPTEGEVKINGFDLREKRNSVRRSFGIVFQDQSMDDELTAYENMIFHAVLYKLLKSMREERIDELLSLVDLLDRKKDQVRNYSGGMRRRLEIARALIHRPKIIFLDEPTVGLDPQTRNHIWSYVSELSKKEKVTVFVTTHYMEEAEKVADEILIIDKGKIIGSGTPEKLKSSTGAGSLEEAFLKLTGAHVRENEIDPNSKLRHQAKLWGKL